MRKQRVEVTRDIDLTPYTVLRTGEFGTVVGENLEFGEIEVLMDKHHEGLTAWGNVALLASPETGSIAPATIRAVVSCLNSTRLMKYAAAAIFAALAILGLTEYETLRAKEDTLWSATRSCLTTSYGQSGGCYSSTRHSAR